MHGVRVYASFCIWRRGIAEPACTLAFAVCYPAIAWSFSVRRGTTCL